MGMMQEFKSFAMRGNVVDMAVGIIIGGAFGKIVASFVNDVIMPPIGMLIGGVDFSDLALTLKEAVGEAPAVMIKYGAFIAIFLAVKAMNNLKKKEEEKPAAPPAPSKEEVLLTEIRDLLKERQ
ncbi:MAG: large-conductance mechanosensitive channel [Gammaproteobacteria bacterium SG8_31]|nr:MAG: large-conductance mechanosensitive channel [Gammaproteobacteria bacterium SG8_31]